jgi:PAS domain S-box-containing protein
VTIDSDSTRFSRALQTAILWPVGIIFLTALLLILSIFELFQVVKLSDHSYRVLAQTRTCENLVVSTQNDVRGYLLSGDSNFVKSYETSRSRIDNEFKRLRSLAQDNPEQIIRADGLIQAKNTWLEHARTMVSRPPVQNMALAADWVRMGKTLMDDILAKFDKFADVEEALRDKRLDQVRHMKLALAYAGGALAILLALTVAHVVRKQMMVLAASYGTALKTIEQRHAALVRSEADLEEQKEWLRVTLTSIGDGVIVTDPSGRVVLMNHESERLTGWTNVEALRQPLSAVLRIVDEKTRFALEDPVTRVFNEKKVIGLTNHVLLLSRTGEEWSIEDTAAPICDAKGKILGVVMVFHDATDTRLAQKSLKAYSADLEKIVADRTTTLREMVSELEAFSYSVSHDLRAPLRAMQGFSEAVLEDYGDKLGTQGKNYLERIKNAAGRLDHLIRDLLAYTQISRHDTQLEPLDLNKIVRDIIVHDPNLNPPAAVVHVEGTLPRVLGRESALVQVVTNLLGNAAKFVPPATVPQIRVWGEDRGSRLRLWIEDNGVGIAAQNRERIFDMFVQMNDSQLYGGTGVGLAIVKKAVQTMQGSVGVESEEGSGSRFWVELNKVA